MTRDAQPPTEPTAEHHAMCEWSMRHDVDAEAACDMGCAEPTAERAGDADDVATVRSRADYRLALIKAVVAYDNANQSDLPLGLLDSLRAEVRHG